jgi:hypothetical protein
VRKHTRTTLHILKSSERKGLSYARIGPPQKVVGDAAPLAIMFIEHEVAFPQNENQDPPPETI